MAQVEIFYLTGCPYCRNARRAIEELGEEKPAYRDISIEWIEEREHPEIADARDYYHVPAIYRNGEKLYEAKPTHSYAVIKEAIGAAFDRVLQG